MTVKELKELLQDVPDNYQVGYTVKYTVNENWYGEHTETHFRKLSKDLKMDLGKKELSLFTKSEY